MKRYLVLGILLTLLAGCDSSENIDNEDVVNSGAVGLVDSTTTDEVIVEINDHLQTILNKSSANYDLPLQMDTNFVMEIDFEAKAEQQALNFENVRYLTKNLIENDPTEAATYIINSFLSIDSLKAEGEYEEYVNSLDLGMMKESQAFAEGIIAVSGKNNILLWSLDYSTYEACPYASGALVFGTFLENYEVVNTVLLAEVSGGADAPFWWETRVSSVIRSTDIKTIRIERSGGDEDKNGKEIIEKTEDHYTVEIMEEGFEVSTHE